MILRHLAADVRFSLRMLRRSPGFTATLFFLLVGGIGATTAMFSIVESLLLKPLPYDHPEELVTLWATPMRSNDESIGISLQDVGRLGGAEQQPFTDGGHGQRELHPDRARREARAPRWRDGHR